MPVCEIVSPQGVLSSAEKDRVAERLCPLLLEAEGLPDTAAGRALCLVGFLETGRTYLGGKPSTLGKIVVKIHAFANAYSDTAKSTLYKGITKIFCEEHPASQATGGANVWCLILTLAAGNFGAGGMPVTLEMTRAIATEASRSASTTSQKRQ